MSPPGSCCRLCSRGLYSCNWKPFGEPGKRAGCWFSAVSLVSLLSLCWMYICMVMFNDRDEVNWKAFETLKRWVNCFMVVIILSAVLTSYCVLLLLFALVQVALREPLNLHWLHKIFLLFGVIFIAAGVATICLVGGKGPTIPLSLQATAPFLQFGAVGALTLLSVFVFRGFHMAKEKWSRILIAAMFAALSAAIFLCPLGIRSPCLTETNILPKKPDLIGHRGAPMLAPENTMMSFEKSLACGVTAFETDVQVSKDRIPFLMHDQNSGFLLRTTNVKEKFPNEDFSHSSNLTLEALQSLNAGEWFLKTDPFRSVSQLSEEEKETARNQSIPSLRQLLDLAKQHNVSVIFDLYSTDQKKDTVDTVDAILNSGINRSLASRILFVPTNTRYFTKRRILLRSFFLFFPQVLWLPSEEREYVNKTAPGFMHVYDNEAVMLKEGGNHLNVKYSKFNTEEIRALPNGGGVEVNLWVVNERWLFSLMWCAGASSVTTNSCHLLKDMERPDWFMTRLTYRMTWIAVDLVSALVMTGLFFSQRKKHCTIRTGAASAWNEKELFPFLVVDPTSPR